MLGNMILSLRRLLLPALVGCLLPVFVAGCGGAGSGGESADARHTPAPTPMATQFPEGNRLRIPSIGVFAPMVLSTVPRNGQLADPNSPDEILYFDFRESGLANFGGQPGQGTLVLTGKLDEGTQPCKGGTVPPPCPGVGWDFRRLSTGARVEVYWEKQRYVYTVVSVCYFDRSRPSRDFEQIVTTHMNPTLILMTAGGNFDRATRSYSHTVFVRGALEGATIPPNCPPGMGVAPTPAPTPPPSPTPPR